MSAEPVYRIALVRHGESLGNAEERLQGHADYALSERGRIQILALAQRWKAEGVRFDYVIASSLTRALETARILSAELILAEPEIDRSWIEQDAGSHTGVRWNDVDRAYVDADRAFALEDRPDSTAATGESEADLYLRAHQALDSILQRPPGRYLVVSHRAFLNAVLFAILGVAPQPDGRRRASFRIANGCFSRVRYYPLERRWQVDVIGDRAHCDGPAQRAAEVVQ